MDFSKSDIIAQRQPIWIALSQFYLDTELDDQQLFEISKVISKSGLTIEEVKKIDFFEVYPVLKFNIYDIAGEWEGFNKEWLVNKINENFEGDKIFNRKLSGLRYWWARRFTENYWNRIILR